MTTPYIPQTPLQTPRALYRSVVQVTRLVPQFLTSGAMSLSWGPIADIVDVYLAKPGLLACRLDLQFVRPGKTQPMPLAAGRAPDRQGVVFFDPVADPNGAPLVKAGDRLAAVSGPIFGTFEIRVIPDVAQSFTGAHHIEAEVIEVSQALQPGSPTPFPGVQP